MKELMIAGTIEHVESVIKKYKDKNKIKKTTITAANKQTRSNKQYEESNILH